MTELKSFDRVADVYDETRAMPPIVEAAVADAIVQALRDVAASPWLLEVGIGTGRIACPVAARGVRVTGVDIAPKMLAVLLGKRGDIDVMLAEAARPPFRAGVFDGALFVHVLHLVPDAAETVAAIVPLVRAGGVLMMGGDEWSSGHRDTSDHIIEEAVREVAGVELSGGKSHDAARLGFERVAAERGLGLERRSVATWTDRFRPRRMIERLAARDFSSSWRIPEPAMPDVLRRVEAGFIAEFGDLDAELGFERSFGLLVARVPAS
jgi:SAM-dependent methyltransferase